MQWRRDSPARRSRQTHHRFGRVTGSLCGFAGVPADRIDGIARALHARGDAGDRFIDQPTEGGKRPVVRARIARGLRLGPHRGGTEQQQDGGGKTPAQAVSLKSDHQEPPDRGVLRPRRRLEVQNKYTAPTTPMTSTPTLTVN